MESRKPRTNTKSDGQKDQGLTNLQAKAKADNDNTSSNINFHPAYPRPN